MLNGNLMDYVGRQVMRKSDAARGKITALMHAEACPVELPGMGADDQVFEIVLNHKNNDETHYICARSKVMDTSDFRLL